MFFLNGGLYGIWASRIPAFVERFALGEAALGLLLLCLAGGAILAFPIAGSLSDRIGAARVTRIVAVFYVGALLALSVAPNMVVLTGALLLFGAFHGAMDVSMNGWAAEVERQIGRPAMSFFHAMFSLGAGLGAASGYVAVVLQAGPMLHFWLVALALAALTLPLAAIPWESRLSAGGPAFALPRGALVLVGFVAFSATIGEGAMADWSAVYLDTALGATKAQAALGYTVFSVAMVAMRMAGDRVIHMLGAVPAARLCGGLAALGVLLVVTVNGLAGALTGFALMGLGYAVIVPLAFSRAANDPEIAPGRALASVATLGYGGVLLGPVLIGFVAAGSSLRMALGLLGVFALLIVLLARRLQRD